MSNSESAMPSNGELAWHYASVCSWYVLPTWWIVDGRCACGNAECSTPGKHPIGALVRNGLKDASVDPHVIAEWWGRFPEANIAMACEPSGVVVIDVDKRHGGDAYMESVVEADVEVPPTLRAKTGGGGYHLFYRAQPGMRTYEHLNNDKRCGVDVQYAGDYVLLPGSNHISGNPYVWDRDSVSDGRFELADLGALAPYVLNPNAGALATMPSDTGGLVPGVDPMVQVAYEGAPVGQRHEAIVALVASLNAKRIPLDAALLLVRMCVDRMEQPPGNVYPYDQGERACRDQYEGHPPGTTMEQAMVLVEPFVEAARANHNGLFDDLMRRYNAESPIIHQRVGKFIEDDISRSYFTEMKALNEFSVMPPAYDVGEILAYESPLGEWVVEGWHRPGTNSTLTAQFKSGKTTLLMNLARSLADGLPFLDKFYTTQTQGTIVYFNYEMEMGELQSYMSRMGIVHREKIKVVNMREGSPINIRTKIGQKLIVKMLKEFGASFWIIDPRRGLHIGDEDNNTEMDETLRAVDEVKMLAGVPDVVIAAHTGRAVEEGSEHARGASAFDGWPSARWVLGTSGASTDPLAQRHLTVSGRIPPVPRFNVVFDTETRLITAGDAVTRARVREVERGAKADDIVQALWALGAADEEHGVGRRRLLDQLHGTDALNIQAIERTAEEGRIRVKEAGPGLPTLHWIAPGVTNGL